MVGKGSRSGNTYKIPVFQAAEGNAVLDEDVDEESLKLWSR